MYEYRLKDAQNWIEKLVSTHESGTIIGLPMSGKLRTVESTIDILNLSDVFKVIDLSLLPVKRLELVKTLRRSISDFVNNGGKIVYLENCSINSKQSRRQIRTLDSIRTELGRKCIYIYSFNYDITLRQKSYLNIYYFPYANIKETVELIHQNEKRFDKTVDESEYINIFRQTGGVPFLIKSFFRDGTITDESLNRFISEFSQHQLLEIKNKKFSESYSRLGLLDNKYNYISPVLEKCFSRLEIKNTLVIDEEKQLININGVAVNHDLNSYENEILYFIQKNHRISRSDIATICYGPKKSTEYSDYAIDKIMSRLRQSLDKLGCPSTIIKTNRGFGYSLNNDN